MIDSTEQIIKIPGFDIGAKVWGPEDGKPVLALHGWLDNAASFDYLAPLLQGLRVLAVDSPGCGHSSHHHSDAVPQLLEEIFYMFELLRVVGWNEFDLIGHSRGSIVATYMAAAAPHRVKKLAMIEALGSIVKTPEGNIEQLRESVQHYLSYKAKKGTIYPSLEAAAQTRMNRGHLSFESALALAKRGTMPVEGGVTWTFDRRLLMFHTPMYPLEEQVLAILRSLECACCLIVGKQGLGYPGGVFENRSAQIKQLEIHELEGAHHLHMDDPGPVAEVLNSFFAD